MNITKPLIVIIDDDADDIEILTEALSAQDMNCISFRSGDHFLKNLHVIGALPDLIVLDFNMPRYNGLEVLSRIKSNPIIRNIPVIIYSTSLSGLIQIKLKEWGAFASYTKPGNYTDVKRHAKVFARFARHISRPSRPKKTDLLANS